MTVTEPASALRHISRKRGPLFLVLFGATLSLAILAEFHLILSRPLAGRLDDQEPESHILVTELAFEQTSWRVHHFLPIFTLGAPYNKYIDDHPGAESPDALGNYYYTSTPPLTFVLPYLEAKLTAGTPSLINLRCYNLFLQFASAALLAWLACLCAKASGAEGRACLLVGLTAATVYMTAPECLQSHTITLWAQQFYCVLLVLQILVFLFRPSLLLLALMAFIGCLADWTPYVANFGMAAIAIYSYVKTRDRRAIHIAIVLIAATALSCLCMFLWFRSEFPVQDYVHDLLRRYQDRSTGVSLRWFLPAYINSFGCFAVLGVFALFWIPWRSAGSSKLRSDQPILPASNPFLISVTIIAITLVENLLMKGHALLYSYDRLKGVELLALLIAWGASQMYRRAVLSFAACIMFGLISTCVFWIKFETPRGFSYIRHSEQERIGAVIARTSSPDGPAFFNGEIRGSEVAYAGRNVFEHVDEAATKQNMPVPAFIRQWCLLHHFTVATLYEISTGYPFPTPVQLPRVLHIQRIYTDRPPSDLGTIKLNEGWKDYHPPFLYYGLSLEPILR
jgi:hypothetical protein